MAICYFFSFCPYLFLTHTHCYIYLFPFGCVGSLLLHVGFLSLQRAGLLSSRGTQTSHCSGFSCYKTRALGKRASAAATQELVSYGSRALGCADFVVAACGP